MPTIQKCGSYRVKVCQAIGKLTKERTEESLHDHATAIGYTEGYKGDIKFFSGTKKENDIGYVMERHILIVLGSHVPLSIGQEGHMGYY